MRIRPPDPRRPRLRGSRRLAEAECLKALCRENRVYKTHQPTTISGLLQSRALSRGLMGAQALGLKCPGVGFEALAEDLYPFTLNLLTSQAWGLETKPELRENIVLGWMSPHFSETG